MARASRTDLAVLGALSIEPMTGYAVRAGIRDVLGHFWSESYGQIYPALARLEAEGLVERRSGERPRSWVYALTAAGRERLVELLSEQDEPVPPRNGLLLRLFFGHVLGAETAIGLVRAHRDRAVAQLAELALAREEIDPRDEHAPFALVTLSAGEHAARAAIAWADETIETLACLSREVGAVDGPGASDVRQ
ncbi:PadR family transcriptional regulator [Actinotalea sp.]|uniref:PadR family transcriptional regulator n=1 Tax=Actinotalea sp. TaxID=1872145 RepID=UPI003567FC11